MRLYHFTSPEKWESIQADGRINPSESNVGSARADWQPMGENYAPDVVHLTDNPNGTADALGLSFHPLQVRMLKARGLIVPDKTGVRLAIDFEDTEPELWQRFARRHGINRNWLKALTDGRSASRWWIVPRAVAVSEIVEVKIKGQEATA